MQSSNLGRCDFSHAEHLKLAGVVKDVHAKLRKKYKENGDFDEVWREHTADKPLLHQYADAMHHLAVDHWSKNPETRIDWCRNTCVEYFLQDGLKRCLEKDERRRHHEENAMVESQNQSSNDSTSNDSHMMMSSQETDEEETDNKTESMDDTAISKHVQYFHKDRDPSAIANNENMVPISGLTESQWQSTCELISNSKSGDLENCKACSHSAGLSGHTLCRFCLRLEKLTSTIDSGGDKDFSALSHVNASLDDHQSQAVSDSVRVNISEWGSIEKEMPSMISTPGDREHSFLNPNQVAPPSSGHVTPGLSITPFSGSLSVEDNVNLLSDCGDDDRLDAAEGGTQTPRSEAANYDMDVMATLDEPISHRQVIEKLEKYSSLNYNVITLPFEGCIRLLDVGSCYNPFLKLKEFLAVGIDISPAVSGVYHCDFLHLEMTEPLQLASDTINTYLHGLRDPVERLPRHCFHVVVFSLLLEYFPSSYQRWLCCQKAHELLMMNGLLLIITPDSNHEQKNAPMMKSWKRALESLGFRRWRYTKQEHLHCMAFRKVVSECPASELVSEVSPDMLYIPQDISCMRDADHSPGSQEHMAISLDEEEDFYRDCLLELPQC